MNLIRNLLDSPNGEYQRPVVNSHYESSIPGLFVIGDLAGASVVKLAMEQGHAVATYIAGRPSSNKAASPAYDLIVVGSGAAGLSCALEAQQLGLRVLVLEKNKIANTIEEFPEGKWVYAEPESVPPKGKLWLDGARKEDLIARWHEIIRSNNLQVHAEEGTDSIRRQDGGLFEVKTGKATYQARRVVLASGQHGTPRKLNVPGEDREHVYHWLYSPKLYANEDILVVGGGNSAVEAALALAEKNRVTLSYRGGEFARVFKDNRRKLKQASNIRVIFHSNVKRFDDGASVLDTGDELPYQHAFVLIGAEAPAAFLRSLGLTLENDWTPGRYALLALCFAIAYTIYGVKQGAGHEYWPFRGWGHEFFSFFGRPWSFWYTILYTLLMTVFGIQAIKRWGFDKKDKFQIWRYAALIGFQWTFFFIIPEFLFRYLVGPGKAWRSYGLIYAWPLFFSTFFDKPDTFWVVYGVVLSFILIPILVLFHGKRYCSWICGCGGLAETLGDRWRHLAPKGNRSILWERMNAWVLGAAVIVTLLVLGKDSIAIFRKPALIGGDYYHLICDTWLVGILPVTLYPFFGGKVWCRYWCPLAKMMQMFSAVFTRFRVSRFAILANEKCIACGECSRNCQVGINVMNYALKQETIDNYNSSCIGCGICVTVCPMDVLSFGRVPKLATGLVRIGG